MGFPHSIELHALLSTVTVMAGENSLKLIFRGHFSFKKVLLGASDSLRGQDLVPTAVNWFNWLGCIYSCAWDLMYCFL